MQAIDPNLQKSMDDNFKNTYVQRTLINLQEDNTPLKASLEAEKKIYVDTVVKESTSLFKKPSPEDIKNIEEHADKLILEAIDDKIQMAQEDLNTANSDLSKADIFKPSGQKAELRVELCKETLNNLTKLHDELAKPNPVANYDSRAQATRDNPQNNNENRTQNITRKPP